MNEDEASRSLVSSLADDPGQTIYGPARFGTLRVVDPDDVAALHRLRAPAMPGPAPRPYPPMPAPPPAVTGVIAPRPRATMPALLAVALTVGVLALTALLAVVTG